MVQSIDVEEVDDESSRRRFQLSQPRDQSVEGAIHNDTAPSYEFFGDDCSEISLDLKQFSGRIVIQYLTKNGVQLGAALPSDPERCIRIWSSPLHADIGIHLEGESESHSIDGVSSAEVPAPTANGAGLTNINTLTTPCAPAVNSILRTPKRLISSSSRIGDAVLPHVDEQPLEQSPDGVYNRSVHFAPNAEHDDEQHQISKDFNAETQLIPEIDGSKNANEPLSGSFVFFQENTPNIASTIAMISDSAVSPMGKNSELDDTNGSFSTNAADISVPAFAPGPRRSSTEGNRMASLWGSFLSASFAKRSVPRHIVEARSMSRSQIRYQEDSRYELHRLCAIPKVRLSLLRDALRRDPRAASRLSPQGCLPLHILGANESLLAKPHGRAVASTFAMNLMKVYPDALTTDDQSGHYPFVSLISDWCSWVYEDCEQHLARSSFISPVSEIFDRASMITNPMTAVLDHIPTPSFVTKLSRSESTLDDDQEGGYAGPQDKAEKQFPRTEVWVEVEWCFAMLSMAIDELNGKNGGLFEGGSNVLHHHRDDAIARDAIAQHLARKVPAILKTILLMDPEEVRAQLLETSIIRRLLLCPESVGVWLTNMLQHRGVPTERAVDYLITISKVTPKGYAGSFRSLMSHDLEEFSDARKSVFQAIEGLRGVIASLTVLDPVEVERAASTRVIWHITNRSITRPFIVGLVLIDLVLHITLMLSFRRSALLGDPADSYLGTVPFRTVLFICSHYVIRKFCEAFSLLRLSFKVFRSYFFSSAWTMFDLTSIILTMVAVMASRNNPDEYKWGLNAFVVGLLWLKVLGYLMVVNKHMATFIMALLEILRDLRYFLVVLLAVVFMFGDMLHIAVSTKDNGAFCALNVGNLSPPAADFCSARTTNSYLRVYGLLLGDFELADYRDTQGMTALFIVFTMIGVIILLNVLIALVSDSYEKATLKGSVLFGRARVTFVAQNEALETFLRPGSNPLQGVLQMVDNPRTALVVFGRTWRWLVLLSLVLTSIAAQVFLVLRAAAIAKNHESWLIFMMIGFLAVVLSLAICIVVSFAFQGVMHACAPTAVNRGFDVFSRCSTYGVSLIGKIIFGASEGGLEFEHVERRRGEEEWCGRLAYIESSFERCIDQAKIEFSNEIRSLERRLNELRDDVGDHDDWEEDNIYR